MQAISGDAPAAAYHLLAQLPNGSFEPRTRADVLKQWANSTDNWNGATYLASLPLSHDRDLQLSTFGGAAAIADPKLAAQVIASIRAPEVRAEAIEKVANILSARSEQLSVQWLIEQDIWVGNEDRLTPYLSAWRQRDPEALNAYLDGLTLPDERRQRLLARSRDP